MTSVSFVDRLNFCSEDGDERGLGSEKSKKLAAAFLYNNSHALRSIHIAAGLFCTKFWERMASCRALRELELHEAYSGYDVQQFVAFWRVCSQLESLTIYRMAASLRTHWSQGLRKEVCNGSDPGRSTLKYLMLLNFYAHSQDPQDYLWWFFLQDRFPDLESLNSTVGLFGSTVALDTLCHAMAAGVWKILHSFNLQCHLLEDRHLVIIIGAMMSLQ